MRKKREEKEEKRGEERRAEEEISEKFQLKIIRTTDGML